MTFKKAKFNQKISYFHFNIKLLPSLITLLFCTFFVSSLGASDCYSKYLEDRRNADVIDMKYAKEKVQAYKKAMDHLDSYPLPRKTEVKVLKDLAGAYYEVAEIMRDISSSRVCEAMTLAQMYSVKSMTYLLTLMNAREEQIRLDNLEFAKKVTFSALEICEEDYLTFNNWITGFGNYVDDWLAQFGQNPPPEKYKAAFAIMENAGDYLKVDPELQNIYYEKYLDYLMKSFDDPKELSSHDIYCLASSSFGLVDKMNNYFRKKSVYGKGYSYLNSLFECLKSEDDLMVLYPFFQKCLLLPYFVNADDIKLKTYLNIVRYSATAASLCRNKTKEAEYWEQVGTYLLKLSYILPDSVWAPPALYHTVANAYKKGGSLRVESPRAGDRDRSWEHEAYADRLEKIYIGDFVPNIASIMDGANDEMLSDYLVHCEEGLSLSSQETDTSTNNSSYNSDDSESPEDSEGPSPLEAESNEAYNQSQAKGFVQLGEEMRSAAEKAKLDDTPEQPTLTKEIYSFYSKMYKSSGKYYRDAIYLLGKHADPSLYMSCYTVHHRLYSLACELSNNLPETDREIEKTKAAALEVASVCIQKALGILKGNARGDDLNHGFITVQAVIERARKAANIWPLFEKGLSYHEAYIGYFYSTEGKILDSSSLFKIAKEFQKIAGNISPFQEGILLDERRHFVHSYIFHLMLCSRYTERAVKSLDKNAGSRENDAAATAHLQEYRAIEDAYKAGYISYAPEKSLDERRRLLENYLLNLKNKDNLEVSFLDTQISTLNLVGDFLSRVCSLDNSISSRYQLVDFLARGARSINVQESRYKAFKRACSEGMVFLQSCDQELKGGVSQLKLVIEANRVEKDFQWACQFVTTIFLDAIKCATNADERQARCDMIIELLEGFNIELSTTLPADGDELLDIEIKRLSLIKYVLETSKLAERTDNTKGNSKKWGHSKVKSGDESQAALKVSRRKSGSQLPQLDALPVSKGARRRSSSSISSLDTLELASPSSPNKAELAVLRRATPSVQPQLRNPLRKSPSESPPESPKKGKSPRLRKSIDPTKSSGLSRFGRRSKTKSGSHEEAKSLSRIGKKSPRKKDNKDILN